MEHTKHNELKVHPDIAVYVHEHYRLERDRIASIKLVRHLTCSGLREAKEWVDKYCSAEPDAAQMIKLENAALRASVDDLNARLRDKINLVDQLSRPVIMDDPDDRLDNE